MKRVLTALALVPFVLYAVVWASKYVFLVVLCAVAMLCWREYARMVDWYGFGRIGPPGYAAGLVILVTPNLDVLWLWLAVVLAFAVAIRSAELEKALPLAALFLFGLLWVFGAWRAAIGVRSIHPYWLVFALTISWVGDTAAYYAGRALGRHKLAPRLSPGKSWEGAAASVAITLAYAWAFFTWLLPQTPIAYGLVIAAAGNIAGQFGDLCESAVKRGVGVKDSGTMLPGHGGWLDRLDSSLFALPAVLFLLLRPWAQ
jgi:phosphatidate cytidylyltransferase